MKRIDVRTIPLEQVLEEAVAVLAAGGLVLFPTETVYGAGVDATNQVAVDKLLAYKSRREGKPLSIAVTDITMAQQYVDVNEQAQALYQQFLPGPVTVVSKSLGKVADGVASEFGTLGIRIPDYPLLTELVKKYGAPITATSANASGKKRPHSVEDVLSELSQKQLDLIDLILDAGELPKNEPSTVIDTTLSTPLTMRAGKIKVAAEKITDSFTSDSEEETKSLAGKLLLKHWNNITENGLVIGLDGSLGAGKTVFAKGVAEFLSITEPVTSPTYTYIEEYEYERHNIHGHLQHLDLWKIESAEELERLAVPELLKPNTVVVIEWWSQVAEWLEPLLPKKVAKILVTISDDQAHRKITIHEK